MARRRVHIVPHTHWDREWYSPFQTFRLQLVDLLDQLLPALEADLSYAHFLLDGQMAVVEDYLEVRPEAEERLRALAGGGRVAMGPWYVLPDEFLVSGETLVRNLQRGLRVAARFGGAMEVGYLPDMFGHLAQMPQLLRLFGIEHAVVWRGVPSAVDRSGFWWASPDGSTVRAEYLPQGYGNGARVPDDAKALLRRIAEFEEEQGELLTGPILWMNGTDHLMPQPWLGRVVAEANELAGGEDGGEDGVELHVCSLVEHLRRAPTEGLPSWTGELRSGARANLLAGVASNRVDVKQAAARAERALERLAEPLSALVLPPEAWPARLLDRAWLEVIRNSAHDSICACSVDEVGAAVLHRFAEATQIAEGLARRATEALGATVAVDGRTPVLVNPSARERAGVVELRLPGEHPPPGTQLVSVRPAEQLLLDATPIEVATVTVAELEYLDDVRSFTIEDLDGAPLVSVAREPGGALVTPAVRRALHELRRQRAGQQARVRVVNRPEVTVLAATAPIPGFGWRTWEGPVDHAPVTVTETSLDNGFVQVEVDPADGTFRLDGVPGYGRLVDGGDVGDTYTWCPPPEQLLVDQPLSVTTRVVEAGPVRGRLEVVRTYALPTHAEQGRRAGRSEVEVRTTLGLGAGEDLVRVTVAFDNHGRRDHRLRVHLPLPERAGGSRAECAFAVVERGLTAEGGATEVGVPTFPSRRFVTAGGLTVAHEGLLEYELVDVAGGTAGALALTLLRATGMLSRGPMATRPLPAGPLVAMEGPQLQQPVEVRFALHAGGRDPYAVADDAFLPPLVTRGGGPTGARPAQGQLLAVRGAEVSALTREAGQLHLRVFNPGPEPATVEVEGRRGWLVDLRGRPLAPFEGSFTLQGAQVATAVLAGTSGHG